MPGEYKGFHLDSYSKKELIDNLLIWKRHAMTIEEHLSEAESEIQRLRRLTKEG